MGAPEVVETVETEIGVMRIYYDDDAPHPREDWDIFGTIYHWHRKYDLGERVAYDFAPPADSVALPVFMYDHGGVTLSCGAFADRFDSGQVGWIVATADDIRHAFQCETIPEMLETAGTKRGAWKLKMELEMLDGVGLQEQVMMAKAAEASAAAKALCTKGREAMIAYLLEVLK